MLLKGLLLIQRQRWFDYVKDDEDGDDDNDDDDSSNLFQEKKTKEIVLAA